MKVYILSAAANITMFDAGDIVSHYEIAERLGGGGMGVVYRARDTKLNREVALKFLPPDLSRDEEANARFMHEAQAASALNHPNICTVYEVGEDDRGDLFIAMALYEGRTLKKMIADAGGALPIAECLDIAAQIASGLAVAHDKDILHRDIKPANVMVDDRGRAIILDFGLAKLSGLSALTRTGSTLGTVFYMSPEQARGVDVGPSSDLWTLGAVLYEMTTGRKPFLGDYDQAVVYNVLNTEPEPASRLNPEVTDELEAVIHRLLAKDPKDRYDSAEQAESDLRAIRQGGSAASFAPAAAGSAARGKRVPASRTVLASAATIIVAFVIGVTFILNRGGQADAIDSIAVLPMHNLSGSAEQQYFADGMTEALITELSKISALKVTSRQSVMRFRNSDLPITRIAGELGVEAVVQGSVIRSGNQVRVSAQLVSSKSDQNLWADSFDRDMEDILVLHSDLARAIASQIEVTVTPDEAARLAVDQKVNPEAYEEYLKGRFNQSRLSPESLEEARKHYERALEIDPDFALAYAGIAGFWSTSALWGGARPAEANLKALEAIRKAVALGDSLPATMYSLGVQELVYSYDLPESERALRRAIAMDPDYAEALVILGDVLGCLGRFDEAVSVVNRGVEIDPLSPLVLGLKAWVLLQADRYDEAIESHQATLRQEPNFPLALRGLWSLYHREGDSTASLAQAAGFFASQGFPEIADTLRSVFRQKGYSATMSVAASAAEALSEHQYVPAMHIARLHTYAGNTERALDMLEAAYEERFPSMPALGVDLHWDALREEPRFKALLDSLNLQEHLRKIRLQT